MLEIINEQKNKVKSSRIISSAKPLVYKKRNFSMISRVWHGYTTPSNADAYEALLKSEIFTGYKTVKLSVIKEFSCSDAILMMR